MRKKIKKNPKRINKKVILAVIAVVAIVGGIAAFSAFEAHVINVTAHIENALSVDTTPIEFGTVFPQEYLEEEFTINLSSSFLAEDRVDDVEYVINQKPKPIWPQTIDCAESIKHIFQDIYEARDYCHDNSQNLNCCYLTLCPFLSKTDGDPEDNNDFEEPSYYDPKTDTCPIRQLMPAFGRLAKSEGDTSDIWIVDLKVPPVRGYVGQDWPAGCPVVDEDSKDYGCDLWIEVTGISETGEENGKEQACIASGGNVATSTCCLIVGDFPNTCLTGACGCSPENSHEVKVCECGAGRCFNGTTCVDQCFPTTEICDNQVDDDCDGYVDCDDSDCLGDIACEPIVGCDPGSQRACDTGLLGVCIDGIQTCTPQAVWGDCMQDVFPSAEICDGLDNNCDGNVDENLVQSCYTGPIGTRDVGICHDGTQTCVGGFWEACVGDVTPVAEVCDTFDNDCDGVADEGDVCALVNGWTYEQNFNSLADGNLSGQDGWMGDVQFDVQTSEIYEGTKGVSAVGDWTSNRINRPFTGVNDGSVYIAMRVSATVHTAPLAFYEGAGYRMAIGFLNTGYIAIQDNVSGWVNIQTYNADQWYVINIEFDNVAQANKYRARVYDGNWSAFSDWKTILGGSYTNIDTISLYNDQAAATIYWDTIKSTDPTQ